MEVNNNNNGNYSTYLGTPPEISYEIRPSLLSFISDKHLSLALPVIVYWTMGLLFHLLGEYNIFPQYRIHTPEELEKKNKCTLFEVLRAVFLQHSLQTVAGLILEMVEPVETTGHEAYEIWRLEHILIFNNISHERIPYQLAWSLYYLVFPGLRIMIAFIIIDTWQYFLHRYMHMNKFLYKHLHSVHHRLYVPYAFGALYNSILEGFLLDTLGTGIAQIVTQLGARETIILFTFSTMKTVDDHCGYALPWDPFQILFPNNATYHDIHHQYFGIKTNFSQPFFIFWDKLFGTRYEKMEEYIAKQKEIRETKYKEHLEEMNKKKEQ